MSDAILQTLPLPDNLSDAIQRAKKITKRGGLRRELLFIGKIMRSIDVADILNALTVIDQDLQQDKESFHLLEHWRDRLISEPDSLSKFIDQYPQTDIQSLRQQIRLHQTAKKPEQKTKAYRHIFKLLNSAVNSE